jgi:hypothetical protein
LPLPDEPGPLGEIMKGARQADSEYARVDAPALAFCVIYDRPFIPKDADKALKQGLVTRYEQYGRRFEEQQRDHFRRDMKRGRIVELHDTDHASFLHNPQEQAVIVREMKTFLTAR